MIRLWKTKEYNGSYFEIFAILENDVPVGTMSLYDRGDAAYVGIEIDERHRKKGIATNVMRIIFDIAKEKGFIKVTSHARTDNIASVNLHRKCRFEIVEKIINKKGNEVYNYQKIL